MQRARCRDRDLGALPVGDGGRLIGMITDRDIVMRAVAADRGGGTTAVREVMSEGLFTCYDDDQVEDAARLMADYRLRRVPVIDRNEQLVGIISLADLARSGADGAELAADTLVNVTEPTPHASRICRSGARGGGLAAPGCGHRKSPLWHWL
jgi:CBS-domain-containing membrane protein